MMALYEEHYSKLATGFAPGAPTKEELITQLARADLRVKHLEIQLDELRHEHAAACDGIDALSAERDRLRRENEELRRAPAFQVIADCYRVLVDSGQLEVNPPQSLVNFIAALTRKEE